MRQLVVLVILAALGWWAYGSFFGDGAQAAPPTATVPPVSEVLPPNPSMSAIMATGSGAAGGSPGAVRTEATTPGAEPDLPDRIAKGDVEAVRHGWALLARRHPVPQDLVPVQKALTQQVGTIDELLAQLGTGNAFLHSPAGREKAGAVLQAAMALPDGEACTAGTKLVDLCLRGSIEKQDVAARAFVDQAYAQLRVRVERVVCDPANVAGARSYTVGSGDSLNRIASKFRKEGILVEEGTLAVLNRITNKNAIQKDQRIKVPVDPIHSVVEKRSYSLAVYVGDTLLRLYWVGHGKDDKTPVTTFTVAEKQAHPQWTAPDGNVYPYGHPQNILGEYFIKLRHESYTGFGIHGTPEPDTIGTMSSAGCVRMYAPDIAELFEILPRGTKVEVRSSAP